MADTITDFLDGAVYNEHEIDRGYKGYVTNTLDFSSTNATSLAVVQAINVGPGMWVTNVRTKCDTAQGATLTASVGDGDGAASWDASINLNSAGATAQGTDGTDAYVHGGKYYDTADTIDLTMLTPGVLVDTAVATVVAEYVRIAT